MPSFHSEHWTGKIFEAGAQASIFGPKAEEAEEEEDTNSGERLREETLDTQEWEGAAGVGPYPPERAHPGFRLMRVPALLEIPSFLKFP